MPIVARLAMITAAFLTLTGCQSAYYNTMEALGYEKREILVDRVEDARDQQEDAKEQFTTVLDEFKSVVEFDGGDLEDIYKRLERGHNKSKAQSDAVSKKIDSIEKVAAALFKEWQSELDEYENQELRAASAKQLANTRTRYQQLLTAMRRAEATIPPVLSALGDQVLFLKHNLNAQAIASIQGTVKGIQGDITSLITEMQKSIDEANTFIDQMGA